ncbi:LOW QUALITY PROTEIN: histone H1.10-like [Camarhynchus parvulus]|uniref:LOW QUALITY PROTEIN: histone H1.10-like n=1 Tax=Geospiza parvula TaxID=87175 RepID=UPI00123807F7|nr:LOW QUALITY PROTEIN: histone H1.10-like [Camarhynchus parvulus]
MEILLFLISPLLGVPDRPGPAAKKPKKAASGSKARKPAGPSVTELITKAVSASKERKGLSLAALKKALAAGGYDVEKNNSRIKLGLKSLVSKGTLVQTKGTGASGSFRLSKKPGEVKEKAPKKKKTTVIKPKKPAARKPARAAKKAVTAKNSPKKVKPAAKKAAKSPKKATKTVRPKKAVAAAKSPPKAKAVKPKAAKPKRQHTRRRKAPHGNSLASHLNPMALLRATDIWAGMLWLPPFWRGVW